MHGLDLKLTCLGAPKPRISLSSAIMRLTTCRADRSCKSRASKSRQHIALALTLMPVQMHASEEACTLFIYNIYVYYIFCTAADPLCRLPPYCWGKVLPPCNPAVYVIKAV